MAERSGWTHAVCLACYGVIEPGRVPQIVVEAAPEACCRCDEIADPPIFYRAAPGAFRCGGVHHEPDPSPADT